MGPHFPLSPEMSCRVWATPKVDQLGYSLHASENEVGRTDNIHDTVNYGEVVERVARELAERRFKLLEALAEHCCDIIVNDFRAPWVRLSVAKLGHIRNVRKVGVAIERRRDPGA